MAFNKLKNRLSTVPVLIPPNWNKPFEVHVDASNFAIGSVLSQKNDEGHDRPIYFSSRQPSAAEKNYSVTEREGLGMVYSVEKYRHYFLDYKVTFHIDHDALKYMVNKPQLSGRIARWVLLLQEFDFDVDVRPRKKNMLMLIFSPDLVRRLILHQLIIVYLMPIFFMLTSSL